MGTGIMVPVTSGGSAALKIKKGLCHFREVYGVVKDTAGKKLEGATIKLISATDSVVTSTGPTGKFRFGKVKSATFVITVTSVGFPNGCPQDAEQ
jgi:hypothetical protein